MSILNDLVKGQNVYNNVIFKSLYPYSLWFRCPSELINITFHNCTFERISILGATLINCLFDHCIFNDSYIDDCNDYDNVIFSCCVFNRCHIYITDQIFETCVYNETMRKYHHNWEFIEELQRKAEEEEETTEITEEETEEEETNN